MKGLFEHRDYRDFLNNYIESLPRKGRGIKKNLARHLYCQTTHISQVLGKRTNLTLEQGVRAAEFIHLTHEEKKYFMLLLNLSRAGSKDLEDFFEEERAGLVKQRKRILEKMKTQKLLDQTQRSKYYNNWYYSAIHVLVSISEFSSAQALIDYLPLPDTKVLEALGFLEETGLVEKVGEKYQLGTSSLQKPEVNSDEYKNFLKSWRNQAVLSIDRGKKEDHHNTIAISISKDDATKIEELISAFFQEVEKLIPESKEEELKVLSIDFFGL
ncbi:MAG: hypothetical protein DRQ88_10285 [Epsilonproteobacteria bacterium]|nr:MAG: hypothetical protein DRQ89_03015 [Campylobacterota bacterium]RLA64867.1 MAG: hypothetical protein DRQ88_10285 [Campylobacterota bacterium]